MAIVLAVLGIMALLYNKLSICKFTLIVNFVQHRPMMVRFLILDMNQTGINSVQNSILDLLFSKHLVICYIVV